MPHESLRSRARRKARLRIAAGLDVGRRVPTPDELNGLVAAVKDNAQCAFGLVRLEKLDLDVPAPSPEWIRRVHGWWLPTISLMQLAALLGRDAIVLQLVRAGASPVQTLNDAATAAWPADDHPRRRDADRRAAEEFEEEDDGGSGEETEASNGTPGWVGGSGEETEASNGTPRVVGGSGEETGAGGRDDGEKDEGAAEDDGTAETAETARRARGFLRGLRTPHAAWLIVTAARMRRRAVAGNARRGDEPAPSEDEPPPGGCAVCARRAPRTPVTWRCGHVACEACAWSRLLETYDAGSRGSSGEDEPTPSDAEWTCHACGLLEDDEEGNEPSPSPIPAPHVRWCAANRSSDAARPAWQIAAASRAASDATSDVDHQTWYAGGGDPSAIAAASRARFLALAPEATRAKVAGPRTKFRAAGPRACARSQLGASRPKRTEALLAAAAAGETRRVVALVEAGVDVNAADEYGATAIFLAAWRGRRGTVAALLAAGADPGRTTFGGCVGASEAAAAGGHVALARAMASWAAREAGEAEGEPPGRGNANRRAARRLEDRQLAALARLEALETAHASGERSAVTLRILVDPAADHPGANWSFTVDGGVSEATLTRLEAAWRAAVEEAAADAEATRVEGTGASGTAGTTRHATRQRGDTCAERSHFCDVEGWARGAVLAAARRAGMPARGVHLQMRVLHYPLPGGVMAPHVDLSKPVDPEDARWRVGAEAEAIVEPGRRAAGRDDSSSDERGSNRPRAATTHTFLLYLRSCAVGGETALLRRVKVPPGVEGAKGAEALADVAPVRGRLLVFPHDCPHAGRPVVDAPKLVLRGEIWS